MLRVGLTGNLGSGKSAASKLFAAHGAHVLDADTIGRELMEPGQPVYAAFVEHFGKAILSPDRTLDRHALAKIAFTEGRVEELNAIVHPAAIARQAALTDAIFQRDPRAIVIVESALIFETSYGKASHGGEATSKNAPPSATASWPSRFDRIVLVTAPEELKIARFVARSSAGRELTDARRIELEDEARRRLARQIPDEQKSVLCDYILTNNGALAELEWQVDHLWPILQAASEEMLQS